MLRLTFPALVLVILLSGCSGGTNSNSPSADPEPQTPTPAPDGIAKSQMVPFILPWNDGSGGVTNMGNRLNHKPAGQFGPVAVNSNGHFTLGAERVRFWGVNITGSSCFPSPAEAAAIAKRLAKFGVNLVRFHHMDHNWGGLGLIDYSRGNSRHLNSEALERLDYFIAQLKAEGIYVNLNLINAREFSSADSEQLPPEMDSLEWKQRHVLGFFIPALRDLEKEYAYKLLTHFNPYTELSYGNDPAVAFVEVNNENSLFQQYYDGHVDSWPTPLRAELQRQWNTWLKSHYGSTAELESAWGAADEPLGAEKLVNGDFSQNLDSWNLENHEGAVASAAAGVYGDYSGAAVTVSEPASDGWHVQFIQPSVGLAEGRLYTLSFLTKATDVSGISVALQQNYSPWGAVESRNLNPTQEWQAFSATFVAPVSDDNLRINFSGVGNQVGTLYLANVSLRPGGRLGHLPEGESLEAGNVSLNLYTDRYTHGRAQDWMRFIRSLERDYWADMHGYVRDTLAFPGLVTGTQLMNSPPSVQQEFPFIDAHAYWQHPIFPRVDWDPQDWTVSNESMVNTLNNTISQLATQRLVGKPFTVSEYQHASPNTYSSEAPLLIAAYAALQDWDGIYLFSYDAGADGNWSPGYFNNFFSLNAHPTKMANMALAANVFRRGDVEAARNLVLLNFDSQRELEILAAKGSAWNVANGSHLNPMASLAHGHRLALDATDIPTGVDYPPAADDASLVVSDTGQLSWDLQTSQRGLVTVNTPATKAAVGFIEGQTLELGEVSLLVGETRQAWATVGLTMQTGRFDEPDAGGSLLIVATGTTENTGMQWTDSFHRSVGSNWGRSPTLVEVIPMRLELPFAADRTKAWTLDEAGQRHQPLEVHPSGQGTRLELDGATGTLWYEVAVTPAVE